MIGGTYEYLMSSLPNLSFQNTDEAKRHVIEVLNAYSDDPTAALTPLGLWDREAQKFLPADAFNVFKKIYLANLHELEFQKSKSKVLSAFSEFNFELKKEIIKWKTSQTAKAHKAPMSNIENLVGHGTPLEKEINIMKYQWDKLEDIATGHFADMETVFTYKLKLMILLRWWSFNTEIGFNKFTRISTNC